MWAWAVVVLHADSSGAGRIHLKKFGFLEEQINDGLAKNARKREKC